MLMLEKRTLGVKYPDFTDRFMRHTPIKPIESALGMIVESW
jgi:hypothetical protein